MSKKRKYPEWLEDRLRQVAVIGLCPCHDSAKNTLVVWTDARKQLHLGCLRGCTEAAILQAMDKTIEDLRPRQRKVKVAEYLYRNIDGTEAGRVIRYRPKSFEATPGIMVLYRLPELLEWPADRPVFIVEGEKDADRLCELGLFATTSPYGASSWSWEYTCFLGGRDVIILPDNDAPGRQYAQSIRESLSDVAECRCRVVQLPVRYKGDVSDWLDSGHGINDLWSICELGPLPDWLTLAPTTGYHVNGPVGDLQRAVLAELPGQTTLSRRALTVRVFGAPPTRSQSASLSRAIRQLIRRHILAVHQGKICRSG